MYYTAGMCTYILDALPPCKRVAGPGILACLHKSCMTPPKLNTGQIIRLKGRNLTENEHVKLGAYHTLELELQRAFSIEKVAWDAVDLDRIRQCTDPAASADLAAVLITVCWRGGKGRA